MSEPTITDDIIQDRIVGVDTEDDRPPELVTTNRQVIVHSYGAGYYAVAAVFIVAILAALYWSVLVGTGEIDRRNYGIQGLKHCPYNAQTPP